MKLITESKHFIREKEAILSGHGSHAYLIEGVKGIGKTSTALAFACANFCLSENKPCFTCKECRKVLEHNHPDVHIFEPDRGIFRVDQAREIISTVYESSYEGGNKIYIIKDFHKANEQAQNCLLKTLEEPPKSVIFYLLTENAHASLPTVRSRCKTFSADNFSDSEIYAELKEHFPDSDKLDFAVSHSGGNIGNAIKLINDENYVQICNSCEKIVSLCLKNGSYAKIASVFESEKDNLQDLLPVLENQFYIQLKNTPDRITLERIKAVQDAISGISKHFNEGLIIEELSYTLAKGGTKWQR